MKMMKDKCITCGGQFKPKQGGYHRYGTNRKVDGQTVAKLLQHYSLEVSCANGFLCYYCFSELSKMAKFERRLMSRCKKKECPKVRTKRIIKRRNPYNILISVNSQQEKSIKNLFKRNNWNCKYKVLPPIFSYLWDLEMDKENPSDGVLKVHKVADDKDVPNGDQSRNNINSGIMGMKVAVFMKNNPHRSSSGQMVISKETASTCSEEKFVEEELVQIRKEESDDEQTKKEESDNDADDNEDDNEVDAPADKEPNNMPCNNIPDNVQDDNKLNDKDVFISDTDDHRYASKVIALEELSSTTETKDEEPSNMPYDNESDNIQDDVEMLNDKDVFISNADNQTSKSIALEEFPILAEIKDKEPNKLPYDNEPDNIQDDGEIKSNHKDVFISGSADNTYTCMSKTIALEELPSIAETQENDEEQDYMNGSSATDPVEKMDDCSYKRKKHAENQNSMQDGEDDKNKQENSRASKKLTNICNDCGKALYPRKGKKTDAHCDCRVKCQFCDKQFVKSVYGNARMETHIKAHQGFRPFKCNDCDKTYTTAHYLKKHRNQTHMPENFCHPCTICSKVFTKSGLKAHMLYVHTDRRLFQCDLCGACFKLKGGLSQHIAAVHAKQRNFSCDICSAAFTTSHNLQLHRVRHTADQKIVCTICGKIIQVTGYRDHMKRHANQRTFKCEKCSKCFFSNRELVNHNRVHTGDRPFKCHLCSYTCAVKGNLTKHMIKHRTGAVIPDHMYKGHFMRNTDPEKMGRASDNRQTIPESDSKGFKSEMKNKADKLYSAENDFLLKNELNIPSSAELNDQVNMVSELSILKHDSGSLEKKNEGNNQGLSRIETFSERNTASVVGQVPLDTALNVGTGHGLAEIVGITHDNNTPKQGVRLAVVNYDGHVKISSISDPNYDIQISSLSRVYEGHQSSDEGREESLYQTVTPYFN